MNRIQLSVLVVLCSIAFGGRAHAVNYFKAFQGHQAPSKGKQVLVPDAYRIVTADQQSLHAFLNGLSSDPAKKTLITLPAPDGSTQDFYIWKTSMMEAPLQAMFPQIQTFTAEAKNNRQVTAKVDINTRGFHAMVFQGDNTYLIDPYADVADGYYSVYYKKDYHREGSQLMVCEVDDASKIADANGSLPEQMDGTLPGVGLKQYGGTRKQFRLALSCTGEYAVAVGGTTPTTASVLSAMVTSMNRVNGIYEREVGVTMIMIGNNDQLVYLDPNNDPFTANFNGGQLLAQNQSNTASVIGTANFDIGHIFSTGGGGIAAL
ncbi:MAG: hypothetical protein EOP49_46615, partial [Sphingobacteriales bacterium]